MLIEGWATKFGAGSSKLRFFENKREARRYLPQRGRSRPGFSGPFSAQLFPGTGVYPIGSGKLLREVLVSGVLSVGCRRGGRQTMKIHQRFISILVLSIFLPFSGLMASAQEQGQQPSYPDQSAAPDQSAVPDQAAAPEQSPNVGTNTAPDSSSAQVQDAPARAARLQYMEGSVSVQPQGTGEWVAGQLNRPLTNADNVWADKNSKAEISVGTGLIRLDSETSLTLSNIGENAVQLSLHQGAMNLHVRRLYDNETYEVDTPNQAFTILKPGDYRFDVDSDADKTIITVWRGEGEAFTNGQTVKIGQN